MKTVGIIGGLGPETTAKFYLEVNFGCLKLDKSKRPPMLIWNVPLDLKIESDLLEKNIGQERYLPFLIDPAKRLEAGGADFLVMPCNTMHIFIGEIRQAVKIPVLSIVEETVRELKQLGIAKIGILATSTTIDQKLYEAELKKFGITQVLPDNFAQAKIGRIISNLVANRHNNNDRQELIKIIDAFADKDVKDVILACTDLQLLIPNHPKLTIHDSMQILAKATVREVLRSN